MSDERDLERQLRESLRREALRMTPRDRLDDIREQARTQADRPAPRPGRLPGWLVPVGAAAAAAVIAVVVWASGPGGTAAPANPAASTGSTTTAPATSPATPSATSTPTQSASGTSGAGTPTIHPTSPRATPTLRAVPVYFNGFDVQRRRPALFREFVAVPLPADADDAARASKSVQLALAHQGCPDDQACPLWHGTTMEDIAVEPLRITITLSDAGSATVSAEEARLAVQQLVWSAQAAVGKGRVPVRFALADGSDDKLFGRYPLTASYNRPPAGREHEDLAAVWVDSPGRGALVPAGRAVVVTGSACVTEPLMYELDYLDDPAGRDYEGSVVVSTACPSRGSWSLDFGRLAPGEYAFRVVNVVTIVHRTFSVG